MSAPVISSVVLNWNRKDLLERTVTSCLATVTVPHELYVVDNGSTDGSTELLQELERRHPSLTAIHLPANIGGLAVNEALQRCRGRLLHVSGNDLEYQPGWDVRGRTLFEAFDDLGQLSVYAPVPPDDEVWTTKPCRLAYRRGEILYVAESNVGGSCLLRREIWDRGVRVRNLPTAGRFLFPDDGRLSADVRRLGYVVAWAPENLVVNLGHRASELAGRAEYYAQNYASKDGFGLMGLSERLAAWQRRARPNRASGATPHLRLLPELSPPSATCPFPQLWSMLDTHTPPVEALEFVRALVRWLKPETTIESAAWLGHRTRAIAEALVENGTGHLYAFETDPDLREKVEVRLRESPLHDVVTLAGTCPDLEAVFSGVPRPRLCIVDMDAPAAVCSLRTLSRVLAPDACLAVSGRIDPAERDRLVREQMRSRGELDVVAFPGPRDLALYRLRGVAASLDRPSARPPRAAIDETANARLFRSPNQYARPVGLELTDGSAIFHGYQEFVLTRHSIVVAPDDQLLARKHELLRDLLSPRTLAGRTVLDLGANAAFFCFVGLQQGASRATAVDIDRAYIDCVTRAAQALAFAGLDACEANAAQWHAPADCVLALALMHWIYSGTAGFESVHDAVRHLDTLTRHVLVVEWVEPDDEMIRRFGHLTQGGRQPQAYTRADFEQALGASFARVDRIGDVSPSRSIYAAWRSRGPQDAACPLPLLRPREQVISSKLLVTYRGVDYWSVVYDGGDRIVKQATLDLAEREAHVLSRLEHVTSVPRVLGRSRHGAYSVIEVERVDGTSIEEATPSIAESGAAVERFVTACLDLLVALQDGRVLHRDIRPENLLVRDGLPVLIDFGWALAAGADTFDPWAQHGLVRGVSGPGPDVLADGLSADVYAMGRLLQSAFGERRPELQPFLALMTAGDPALRLADAHVLRGAWRAWNDELQAEGGDAPVVTMLVDHVFERDSRLALLEMQYQRSATARAHAERAMQDLEHRVSNLEREALVTRQRDNAPLHAAIVALGDDEVLSEGMLASLGASDLAYLTRLASALRSAGQVRKARSVARSVLRGLPMGDASERWLTAAYLAASCSKALGELDESAELFSAVNDRWTPRQPAALAAGALFHRADIHEHRGDLPRAVVHLERCLQLLPEHRAARAALDRLGPKLGIDR